MSDIRVSQVLHDAVDDVASDLDPQVVWAGGRRRRRRSTWAIVAGASTAAAVIVVGGLLLGPSSKPPTEPAPSPTSTTPPSPGTVEPSADIRMDPTYDPADWEDLPDYPVDLGWWPSPDRLVPLAQSPVDRATAAVSFDLGGGVANLSVLGSDDRWRSVDVEGLVFSRTSDDSTLGLTRDSLSPDGTAVALGQPDGVVVIDLTTAQRRTYPVEGLGPVWHGRETSWTVDGGSVLIARSYIAFPSEAGYAYQPGLRLDLTTGEVTETAYDPGHAAHLADGTIVTNQWSESSGHRLVSLSPDGEPTDVDQMAVASALSGASSDYAGEGQRWAIRREAMMDPDGIGSVSGFMVFDGASVEAMLPVVGVKNNGGGGRVVGWLDGSTLLFSMPAVDDFENLARSVAWDVATGTLWKGPSILTNSRVSIARE